MIEKGEIIFRKADTICLDGRKSDVDAASNSLASTESVFEIIQYNLHSVSSGKRVYLMSGAIFCTSERQSTQVKLNLLTGGSDLPFTSQDGAVSDRTPGMANSARRRRATDVCAGRGASMASQKLEAIDSTGGQRQSRTASHLYR